MTQLHPSEIRRHYLAQWRNQVIGVLAVTAGTLGLGGLVTHNNTAILGSLLSTTVAGRLALRTRDEQEFITQDITDISDQARTNRYYHLMKPQATPVQLLPELSQSIVITPFDWGSLNKHRWKRKPHKTFECFTGGGKSYLAQWLAKESTADLVVVVDPHYQMGSYPSADIHIGKGRNYGTDARPYVEPEYDDKGKLLNKPQGEPEVNFRDIIAGTAKPTVCQFWRALVNEMDRRYQLVDPGTGKPSDNGIYRCEYEKSPDVDVILDEFNAYANYPGVRDCLKQLLREARKVRIGLSLIIQGSEVAAMGIEGEGSLRDQLIRIRLQDWAVDHARSLRNKWKPETPEYQYWTEVISRLTQDERPCMVEDSYAVIPEITLGTSEVPVITLPRYQEDLPEYQLSTSKVPVVTEVPSELWGVKKDIIQYLIVNQGTASVQQIAAKFNLPDPVASSYLTQLEGYGYYDGQQFTLSL